MKLHQNDQYGKIERAFDHKICSVGKPELKRMPDEPAIRSDLPNPSPSEVQRRKYVSLNDYASAMCLPEYRRHQIVLFGIVTLVYLNNVKPYQI